MRASKRSVRSIQLKLLQSRISGKFISDPNAPRDLLVSAYQTPKSPTTQKGIAGLSASLS
jgi:hypothetical protein